MTVREVARRAGVSLGTVSRVLNGSPTVTPEIDRRVRKAVRALGYTPIRRRSGDGRPLRGRTLALVILGMNRSLVGLPVIAEAIHGAESALSGAGASVLLVDAPDVKTVPAALKRTRIDGVILKSALQGDVIGEAHPELVDRLKRVPGVWILGRPENAWGDAVSSNDESVGRLAAEALLARGHRRLAYLNPKPDHTLFARRQASFVWHAKRAGARVESFLGRVGDWSLPLKAVEGVDAVRGLVDRLLSSRKRPTALFVPGDSVAAMVYRSLAERGLEAGRDLSIVSCNNEESLLMGLHPALTTIDVHASEIGRRAVEQLAARLANRNAPPVEIGIEPALVEGGSIGSPAFRRKK